MGKENPLLILAVKLLPFSIIFGLVLIPIGITFLCLNLNECTLVTKVIIVNEKSIDYTNCLDDMYSDSNITCFESLSAGQRNCRCQIPFNITSDWNGNITMFYKLENFYRSQEFYQSRDDDQLRGVLSKPSQTCGDYAYDVTPDGRLPIAPCGELADAMFNDIFDIIMSDNKYVPMLRTGLLNNKDKIGFHNPSPVNNLSVAFQNFTKPKNWDKNIWELDEDDPDNNGFQNEAFIAWMSPDINPKPVSRFNVTHPAYTNGLKKGEHLLTVQYKYPLSRYNGTRKAILRSSKTEIVPECVRSSTQTANGFLIGLPVLIIGIVFLVEAVAVILYAREKAKQSAAAPVAIPEDDGLEPLNDRRSARI